MSHGTHINESCCTHEGVSEKAARDTQIECCNTLQHTATHCNTLQHTATHCNTLNTRDTQMRSYGSSELLEITKEDFDRHIKPNYPDVYKAITEMALSRLTGPGSKEALMAMRRCNFSKVNFAKQI